MFLTVNIVGPKKWGSMIPNFEQSIKTPRETMEDDHQLHGIMNIPQDDEGLLGSMYPALRHSKF